MTDDEFIQFYDDIHSHYLGHQMSKYPNCLMCRLVYKYRSYGRTPTEWKPPRKDGMPDEAKIDEYIKGLQS
jgi:hypothetical protein